MIRPYQQQLASDGAKLLKSHGLVYYAIEMRVGKTIIAMQTALEIGAKNVLFVTKKKAISSILADYERESFPFALTVTNYEQLHTLKPIYDLIVVDEAHSIGAYPRASQRQREVKRLCKAAKYVIFLSGTPCPESFSQLYHQFAVSPNSPFTDKNFYAWASTYVNITQQRVSGGRLVNNYQQAHRDKVLAVLDGYFIRYTQSDAGFTTGEINETIVTVQPNSATRKLSELLLKDKLYEFKNGKAIVCDTATTLLTKLHQVSSGTVILSDNTDHIFDISKAEYILQHYANKHIAIFYKFKAEEKVLRAVFKGRLAHTPEEFNTSRTPRVYLSQIQSGSMGVNLSSADYLLFYNIDFSATSYWQSRARIQDLKRTAPANIHWLFTDGGIEHRIYNAVRAKRDYTTSMFKREYNLTTN